MTIEAQGTEIQIGDGESPEGFTKIAKVVDFDGPDGEAATIDVSTLDSTRREKRIGLPDEGGLSLNLIFDPADTDGQIAARAVRNARTAANFRIVFNNDTSPSTRANFTGFVKSFTLRGAVDDVIRGSISIDITGEVTYDTQA